MAVGTASPIGFQPVAVGGGLDPGRDAATRFVDAITARDYRRIFGALTCDARLRYLVPSGTGEATGAAEVAATYAGWFGDADALEVQDVLVQRLADRTSARYRVLVHQGAHAKVVEQQAYLDVDADGQIAQIDLACSGFRPVEDPAMSGVPSHEFDAGTMGCSDGLAPEFRRRIAAIPVGSVLMVTVRDPAAKEDLPPLARMLGHAVRSVEARGDGQLAIMVERGR